jgi:diacylglycerol kinase (ATP)
MKFKNVHIIINPASGKQEPILSYLNKAFINLGINWEILVTQPPDNDAFCIAEKLVGKTDLIIVYGGDGSVCEVARALYGTNTPMAIIPGGTANVMSKELGISQDTVEAIELIIGNSHKIVAIDMGLANDVPFLLRINLGIMADMVLQANRELKDSFGQLAYGVSAIQTLVASQPVEYKLIIDEEEVIEDGVALTVTNAGSIGISDFSLLPDMRVDDGYLDVVLLNDADLFSVIRVAGSTLFQTRSDVLKHWRCKEVSIMMKRASKYIADDTEKQDKEIHIKVIPKAIKILVPKQHQSNYDR